MTDNVRPQLVPLPATRPAAAEGEHNPAPPLAVVVGLFLVLNLFALAGAATLAFSWATQRIAADATVEGLEARGQALGSEIAAAVDRTVARLEVLADDLADGAAPEATKLLDLLPAKDPLVAWAGLADLSGRIVAASASPSVGRDVAHRSWFAEALRAPVTTGFQGKRGHFGGGLMTLAVPVRDQAGRVTGVLAASIGAGAALARFRDTAAALGIEAKLVSASGRTLLATAGGSGPWNPADRAAAIGLTGTAEGRRKAGPGGPQVLVSDVAALRMPNVSWRLAVRLAEDRRIASLTVPPLAVMMFLGAALALYVVAAALLIRLYLWPIARLAQSARAIADGREEVYPYESRRCAEAATLAAALGIIERRLTDASRRSCAADGRDDPQRVRALAA